MPDALTFPLPLEEFYDHLNLRVVSFDLTERLRHSETGGGEVLVADLGPRLWRATIEVARRKHSAQQGAEARGRMLRQAGRSFFMTDPTKAYPHTDPDGSILGSSSVTITEVTADRRRLRLGGLPALYEIPAGAFLSFTYGAPARYALHELVYQTMAGSGGVTPPFEVSPAIRAGATEGAEVRLIRPFCKMLMVPGSWTPGARSGMQTEGFTFDAIQALR